MSAAAISPMPSVPTGACLGQRRHLAADLDLQGVVAGGEDRLDQVLGLRGREVASRVLSRATSAYAVVPSAEIWACAAGANGLATPTTCVVGRRRRRRSARPGLRRLG